MISIIGLRRTALMSAAIMSLFALAAPVEAATFTTTIPDSYWCPYDEATKTTVPANCDTVKVMLTTDKDSYAPGETVSVTGEMQLLNTKSGSNNLLTYYATNFTWPLVYHRYSISTTFNGTTKTIFNYPYGSTAPASPPYTCSKLGSLSLPYCLPTGTASFTAPTTAGTYTVSCSAFIGQALYQADDAFTASIPSSTCKLTITVGGSPDLTTDAINETTAVAGTAKAFSTNIKNLGGTTAPAPFFNILQRADTYNATTDTATNVQMAGSAKGNLKNVLAGDKVGLTFGNYAFPNTDAGTTRYLRACADMSSSGGVGGVVTESNEQNNCGPWTAITVSAGPAPDLRPSVPTYSPTGSPTVSMAVTFSGVVTNIGSATITGAPTTFVVHNSSNVEIARLAGPSVTLAAGSSVTVTSSGTYAFPAVGDYKVRLYVNYNTNGQYPVIAGESNVVNNFSLPVTITIAPDLAKPNLQAGDVNESTATVGTPIRFTTSVSNVGTNTTPDAFWVLLQVSDSVTNNVATDFSKLTAAGYTKLLAAGARGSVTFPSYTFSAAGSKYLRVCADMFDLDDVGAAIGESNEQDNCGNWVKVTIGSDGGGGQCTNGATNYPTCTTCTAPYTLVNGVCTPPPADKPTVSLSANPLRVKKGSATTLTWTSSNATSCSVTANRPNVSIVGGSTGLTNPTPAPTAAITTQTTFTATCTNANGSSASSVTVNILPDFTEF